MKGIKIIVIGLLLAIFLGGAVLSMGAEDALDIVRNIIKPKTAEGIIKEKLEFLQENYEVLTEEIERIEAYLVDLKDREKMQRGAIIVLQEIQKEIEEIENPKAEEE